MPDPFTPQPNRGPGRPVATAVLIVICMLLAAAVAWLPWLLT